MSYREDENGQVVLTLSKESYRQWIQAINRELAGLRALWNEEHARAETLQAELNRLNEGKKL